jgi:hypothetical protein
VEAEIPRKSKKERIFLNVSRTLLDVDEEAERRSRHFIDEKNVAKI